MSAGRRRVGVVVEIEDPAAAWIDGARRAVGDRSLDRIRPHVTLVPPLNLRAADLVPALRRLREAARVVPGPIQLVLGPPTSFLPANPVLYLPVGGEVAALQAVRDAAFGSPLERPMAWPWVPHVTLADEMGPERIGPVGEAIGHLVVVTAAERISLLEERHDAAGRRWEPVADARLGPAVIVGRGGFEVVLTTGGRADPLARALLLGTDAADAPWSGPGVHRCLVVAAHHPDGALLGAAVAWVDDGGGRARVVVEEEQRGQGVGAHLLRGLESEVRAEGWRCPQLVGEGPAGFYRACSGWTVPAPT